jgi:tripartite-type tricarboxylate transporter receptor subunit TctC
LPTPEKWLALHAGSSNNPAVIQSEASMISRRMLAAGALAVAAARVAQAQSYPTRPIKIIVPFSAGGPGDVMARVAGQRMSATLGQNLIVENRAGAGGTTGARAAAQAGPDGYTLMLANTSTMVIGPAVYRDVGYDPLKSFALVALFGVTSNILVVNPQIPANSVRELIALAKQQPGKLSFSSAGIGTPPHLIGEMFKQKAGIDLVHVPYKGGGQATNDVLSGQVQMTFENPSVCLPHIRAGKLRALAATGERRNPQAPEIPTMIEAGVPDFVSVSFTGLVAPAGTPAEIVAKLNAAANDSLASPDVATLLARLAVEARPNSPAEFTAFVARETEKWRAVVKAANVRIE